MWRHDSHLKLKMLASLWAPSTVNNSKVQDMNHHLLYRHNTTSEAVCVVVPAAAVGTEAGFNSLSAPSVQTSPTTWNMWHCLTTLSLKYWTDWSEDCVDDAPSRHVGRVDEETQVQRPLIVSQEEE